MPLVEVYPLSGRVEGQGMGRVGCLARPAGVRTLITRIKRGLGVPRVLLTRATAGPGHRADHRVTTAACGAGSCGGLFRAAASAGASFYLTGEMRHHDLLAAAAAGLNVVCVGHSNSERIALTSLAAALAESLPDLPVTLSRRDRDPIEIV